MFTPEISTFKCTYFLKKSMSKRSLSRIIFIQALTATLGSLYYSYFWDPVTNIQTGNMFSLLNGLSPCQLCRWARILMYPIVIISWIWIRQRSSSFVKYVIPLSSIGIVLEIYHYLLQKVNIATNFTCTFSNPCNALEVNYLWFITIPFLCLVAFVVIMGACVYLTTKKHNK